MINSGMYVSWSIFNGEFGNQAWSKDATMYEVLFVQIGFFVGAIVGGFNSGYFVDSLGRRKVIVSVLCKGSVNGFKKVIYNFWFELLFLVW